MNSRNLIRTQRSILNNKNDTICLQCKLRIDNVQRRRISSSNSRKGLMPQVNMPPNMASQIPKQRSANAQMKELGAGKLPTDFGLLPFTLVRPPGKVLPGWTSFQFRERLRIEWFRLQQSVTCFFQLIYFLKYTKRKDPVTGHKMKSPPLELRQRTQIARDLHQKLYTSIAAGDTRTLREIACDGLAQKQGIRIDQRRRSGKPNEKWKVENYLGITYPSWLRWPLVAILPNPSTKVLVDKIVPLPVKKDSYLRQVIVKIRTLQSLDRVDGKGEKRMPITEYLVMQKTRIGESERDWMIWGTVEPNTVKEIEDIISGVKMEGNVGVVERFKAIAPGFMGGA